MDRSYLTKQNLPDTPGVYLFKGVRGKLLYVGKATSLKDRVRSYFSTDLVETRSSAIASMVLESQTISWTETESVLEALILEANLIKKHQPPYNTAEKDNKSFNYLVVTKEKYPRVILVRGRELFQKWKDADIRYLFGPFPHGGALREALKIVRKIFPYRDNCVPESGKSCFNAQIGLCPGVCAGTCSATTYAHHLKSIIDLFQGKFHGLKLRLEREMKAASKSEHFELAETLRRQVFALKHVRDVSLIKDEYRVSTGGSMRIEAYDVAHTGGSETVAVMTVVLHGEAQKSEYRKFKIHSVTNNDPAALSEILERRLTHSEWLLPRIIVVDGSTAHMRAAQRVLKKSGLTIPVVAVVKDDHHKAVRILGDHTLVQAHEKEILLANAEAHRFGITWHRKRLRQSSLVQ